MLVLTGSWLLSPHLSPLIFLLSAHCFSIFLNGAHTTAATLLLVLTGSCCTSLLYICDEFDEIYATCLLNSLFYACWLLLLYTAGAGCCSLLLLQLYTTATGIYYYYYSSTPTTIYYYYYSSTTTPPIYYCWWSSTPTSYYSYNLATYYLLLYLLLLFSGYSSMLRAALRGRFETAKRLSTGQGWCLLCLLSPSLPLLVMWNYATYDAYYCLCKRICVIVPSGSIWNGRRT
jgi:hypothetical protein